MANVENYLAELADACWQFPNNKSEYTFVGYYAPEMDDTPDMEQYISSWYQSFIGVLRWMV